MKNKHFHEAYKQFMVIVVKRVQSLSADQLKSPEKTARGLIAAHFNKILAALNKKAEKKKIEKKYPKLGKGKGHHTSSH
jgi:hypothetical protein